MLGLVSGRIRRLVIAVGLALGLLLGCGCGCGFGGADAQDSAGAWYDATPLLVSLRPAARATVVREAGIRRAEDLPLYDLDLAIDPAAATFTLREELWLTNTERRPLPEVVLRIFANVVPTSRATPPPITLRGGSCTGGAGIAPCAVSAETPTAIVVRPSRPLAPGARMRVVLNLTGTLERIDSSRTNVLAQGMEGMSSIGSAEAAGDYGLLAIGDGIASLAQFYPVLARRENGQWVRREQSTLGDLGTDALHHVRARIDVSRSLRVSSTGVTTGEQPSTAGPDRRIVSVAAAFVRDFAVVAGATLEQSTRRVGDVDVRAWFLPAERAHGEMVLDAAARSFEIYERRFGPYPYADLDVCEAALVGGAGGVEFTGLVTIASMLYRPAMPADGPLGMLSGLLGGGGLAGLGGTGPGAGAAAGGGAPAGGGMQTMLDAMLEFTTAHEVAHQWWHGIVGSDSAAHPFVDEGLAQWSATLYLEDRYGRARADRDADMQVGMNYRMMRMLGTADGPVDRPVASFASSLAYAGLVYGKGPYVYRELRTALGDPAYFATLRDYVARNRFRIAPRRAFIDRLATGPRAPRVRAIARHWLDEAHGDADLGRADLGSMLGSVLGPGAASQGGTLEQAIRMLGEMGVLQGAGAPAAPGTPARGAGGAAQDPSVPSVTDLLRAMGGDVGVAPVPVAPPRGRALPPSSDPPPPRRHPR